MTVAELIGYLQAFRDPCAEVRAGITDGTKWANLSTPIMQVVHHPGASDEGAYCCLEIPNDWGHASSGKPGVLLDLPEYQE